MLVGEKRLKCAAVVAGEAENFVRSEGKFGKREKCWDG